MVCCSLLLNPERGLPTIPIVKLGRAFQTAQQYSERLEKGIPNILELDHLTVAGDVKFGSDITLKVGEGIRIYPMYATYSCCINISMFSVSSDT